jgi:hypothetical protein
VPYPTDEKCKATTFNIVLMTMHKERKPYTKNAYILLMVLMNIKRSYLRHSRKHRAPPRVATA